MIAALYMVVVLATGGLYWLLGTRNIGEIFSIYDVWFLGTILVTSLAVALRPEPAHLRALGVLWLIYATWWAADLADFPEWAFAFAHNCVALWFIMTMRERWEWLCALCFALKPIGPWAAAMGYWPGYGECGPGFLPFCGPVFVFVLGLVACFCIGLSADDDGGYSARDGRFIRRWLGRPSPIGGLAFRRWR